jgi:AcrR family transcriptional regulator
MPRPSRNVDRLLLRAGRDLFPEAGVAQLSIRKVATRAGVNPAMFRYHFGAKERFVRQLLQEIYDEMFANLELAASAHSPDEGLNAALNVLGRFARDNARLLRRLVADALTGDRLAREFLRTNMPRHVGVLLGLIRSGQRAGTLRPMAPPHALAFLAGSVAAPILIGGVLADYDLVPPAAAGLPALITTDAAIAERVDCALAGLAKKRARAPRRGSR